MTSDDHDEQATEEAEEKMPLRHDEHDYGEASREEQSPFDSEHDPEALDEAARRMLLRDDEG